MMTLFRPEMHQAAFDCLGWSFCIKWLIRPLDGLRRLE